MIVRNNSTRRIKTTGYTAAPCDDGDSNYTPQVILFVAQFISGIGQPLYYTLGVSYMDDNIQKSKTPTFISEQRNSNKKKKKNTRKAMTKEQKKNNFQVWRISYECWDLH